MTVGERVKQARMNAGLSVDELADKIGKNRATVYRYESSAIEKLPTSILEPICIALNVSPAYIMGWNQEGKDNISNDMYKAPTITEDTVTYPVIGELAAGYENIALEDWTGETIEIPTHYLKGRDRTDYIVLKVKGDSMYPHYQNGDIVLILKQDTLDHSGEIGAVLYDNEYATLKKVEYVSGEDWMKLIPLNPEYMPRTIEGVDLERCRVIGVPRLLIRDLS